MNIYESRRVIHFRFGLVAIALFLASCVENGVTPSPRSVTNPFTGISYQVVDGCVIIPPGGTAYGAWTVAGDPNDVNDIDRAELIHPDGSSQGIFIDPNSLPKMTQPDDKICPR